MIEGLQERIDRIFIHSSDSPHGRGDDALEDHRWHLKRGGDGCGYHLIIPESAELD